MLTLDKPHSDESRDLWFWRRGEDTGPDTICCTHQTNWTPHRSRHGYWVSELQATDRGQARLRP